MTAGPDRLDALLETLPFSVTLGMTLTVAEPGEVSGTLPWAPERCTNGGVLHGGALMALADSLGYEWHAT